MTMKPKYLYYCETLDGFYKHLVKANNKKEAKQIVYDVVNDSVYDKDDRYLKKDIKCYSLNELFENNDFVSCNLD